MVIDFTAMIATITTNMTPITAGIMSAGGLAIVVTLVVMGIVKIKSMMRG